MRLLRWALIQSDWCLYEEKKFGHTQNAGNVCIQRKDLVRTQQEAGHLQAKERSPPKKICQHLDLGLLASRTRISVVQVIQCVLFVMAALANECSY